MYKVYRSVFTNLEYVLETKDTITHWLFFFLVLSAFTLPPEFKLQSSTAIYEHLLPGFIPIFFLLSTFHCMPSYLIYLFI